MSASVKNAQTAQCVFTAGAANGIAELSNVLSDSSSGPCWVCSCAGQGRCLWFAGATAVATATSSTNPSPAALQLVVQRRLAVPLIFHRDTLGAHGAGWHFWALVGSLCSWMSNSSAGWGSCARMSMWNWETLMTDAVFQGRLVAGPYLNKGRHRAWLYQCLVQHGLHDINAPHPPRKPSINGGLSYATGFEGGAAALRCQILLLHTRAPNNNACPCSLSLRTQGHDNLECCVQG